ncbi:MAG: hypothetical protein ACODAQ_12980, partial [Phycisphaeraceae bacterium]
ENAMGYYWSGWDSYRQRAREMIEPVVDDMAYTHHYIVEFMVRAYDMVDDSPLLTDAQRVGMDRLIQHNFWTMAGGPDRNWMTTFSPPYESIKLVNRHQIAPWTADLKLAAFLKDYCEPEGDLGDAVAFRFSEKQAFMDHLVEHRWGPSAPGASLTEQIEEPVAAMARYALDYDRYEFFESGNARRGLFLDRINHRSGLLVRPAGRIDHHLIMGMLAHYHEDGQYNALLEEVPVVVHPKGHFQGRYVNGVHRWTPGDELERAPLDSLTGVREPEMMEHVKRGLHALDGDRYAVPDELDPNSVLDLVVFRGGFEDDDDYLAISGIAESYPPGVILNFTSRDVYWLGVGQSAMFSPSSDRYLDQNAVHVLPTDRWLSDDVRYPAMAMRDWSADLHRGGGAGMTLSPFMDTTWRRAVIWVGSGLFLVRDELTALRDGEYDVAVNWRPAGLPEWDGRVLRSRSGGSELRLIPLSGDLAVRENIEAHRAGQDSEALFQLARSGALDEGQHISAVTVLQARDPGEEPAVDARLAQRDTVVIQTEDAPGLTIVSFGPRDEAAIRTDAAAVVIGPDRLDVIDATQLTLADQRIMRSESPTSIAINLKDQFLRFDRLAETDRAAVTLNLPGWRVNDDDSLQATDSDALATLLAQTAATLSEGEVTAPEQAAGAAPIADATDQWREQWRYDGLLRPRMVRRVRSIGEDVVDLGDVVELDEIRAVSQGGPFKPSPLPETIEVALPTDDGRMPALDSDGWQQIDLPAEWQPSARTGNYGQAEPDSQVYQSAKLDGLRARYVRADKANELVYYDRSALEGRRPMLVDVADMDGDGEGEALVKPDIWPKFIRKRELEDDMIALLDADGRERFQREARTIYEDVTILDYLGDGTKQIATAELDAQIEIIDADGDTRHAIDLWQMHESFDAAEGRPNTRQPAGGFTMPYSIGAWRPGPN